MMSSSRSGFSLLELLIVIAVILFFCSGTMQFIAWSPRGKALYEVCLLRDLCYTLQQQAIAEREQRALFCDVAQNRYSCDGYTHLFDGVIFGTPDGVLGPPSAPTHAIKNPVTCADQAIIFMPDGKIKPGTIYVTDTKYTQCYALTMPVAEVSYIRCYHYTTTGWELMP